MSKPFEMKLSDKVMPDGRIIRGKTAEFDRGDQMYDWWQRNRTLKGKKKKKKKTEGGE